MLTKQDELSAFGKTWATLGEKPGQGLAASQLILF